MSQSCTPEMDGKMLVLLKSHAEIIWSIGLMHWSCIARIGVKLSLDHTLIGGISGWAELHATMEDYTRNWYLGPDVRVPEPSPSGSHTPRELQGKALEYKESGLWGPQSWTEAVKMEVPNLFALGHNAVKVSTEESSLITPLCLTSFYLSSGMAVWMNGLCRVFPFYFSSFCMVNEYSMKVKPK